MKPSNRAFLVAGVIVAFLLAGFVSGYASSEPDGLNKVAADKGFATQEQEHGLASSPLADYTVSWIGNEQVAGGVAGVLGVTITLVVGGAVFSAVRLLRRRPGATSSA